MIVFKWSPIVEEAEPIKTIPMCIVLKNVPHKMYSWEGLEFLASAVGKPVQLHPDTELCSNFEEAKLFVETYMTKELPRVYRFKSNIGVDAQVNYLYQWLPPKCIICSKWGHLGNNFIANGGGKMIYVKKKDQAKGNQENVQETSKERDQRMLYPMNQNRGKGKQVVLEKKN